MHHVLLPLGICRIFRLELSLHWARFACHRLHLSPVAECLPSSRQVTGRVRAFPHVSCQEVLSTYPRVSLDVGWIVDGVRDLLETLNLERNAGKALYRLISLWICWELRLYRCVFVLVCRYPSRLMMSFLRVKRCHSSSWLVGDWVGRWSKGRALGLLMYPWTRTCE